MLRLRAGDIHLRPTEDVQLVPALTRRERELLGLLDEGLRFKQIGAALGISETTAKGYARSLFRKLDVTSRAEVVFEARRVGLLDPVPLGKLRAMSGLRRVRAGEEAAVVFAAPGGYHPLGAPLCDLLGSGLAALHEAVDRALDRPPLDEDADVLAPVDRQEVWASGVTYERSLQARMEEARVESVYDLVFQSERPELFMKMPSYRVPAPGAPLRIRADSSWDVPEPELALVLTAQGELAGYLVADDISSRSIEGENPLYLAQAKIYDDALGLSDTIVLARDAGDAARSPESS